MPGGTRLIKTHELQSCQVEVVQFLESFPISRSRRDSVGGGGVVAEFFRDLQEPTRFNGGGGSSGIFP